MMMLVSMISGAGFGGIQMVNRLLIDALNYAGMEAAIVSLHDSPDAEWRHRLRHSFCAGGSKARFLMGALFLKRHARRSIIFVSHINLVSVGRMIKQVSGASLYVFAHGIEAWQSLPPNAMWGMRACDRVVANSQFTLDKFRDSNSCLSTIPGLVLHLPARRLGDSNSNSTFFRHPELRVLIVGRLWGRGLVKGQRQLIELWPQVKSEFPRAELFIVGAGDGRRELEEMARRIGAADSIRFTGQVTDEELAAFYRSSDVYAMPSWGEGFGLVFAEAMSHSLPCIASRFDAGSEVVVDGETGLHVDPENPQEILAALKTLLGDADLRRRMGEAGRRRASELFSLDAFNRKIEKILRGEKFD
jgi:phosphatidylinositol alpha-1,6-mannosyltransferase